jgi:hypothetical protein
MFRAQELARTTTASKNQLRGQLQKPRRVGAHHCAEFAAIGNVSIDGLWTTKLSMIEDIKGLRANQQ